MLYSWTECLNQSRVVSSFRERITNMQIFAIRILMNLEYLAYSYILSFYMSVFCSCCYCFSFSVEFYNRSNILLRPINETLSIPSYQEKCFFDCFVESFHFFFLSFFPSQKTIITYWFSQWRISFYSIYNSLNGITFGLNYKKYTECVIRIKTCRLCVT